MCVRRDLIPDSDTSDISATEESSLKQTYTRTLIACYTGYVVQAIVNNFAPLLFLTFQSTYNISMGKITLLISINFIIQLMTDFLSAGFIDRIGYRASMIIAHAASASGLICLPILPELLPDPSAGLLIAVGIYAVGGGLLEVLVSPVVEALPTKNKEKTMSMLHSFYCWGGACGGRASLDCVLRSVRRGQLADHGSHMGTRPTL